MTAKQFRCVKRFYVSLCDEDGYEAEGGEMESVDVGETFYRSGVTWMNDVRLENDYKWVEIGEETLREYFEEVDE